MQTRVFEQNSFTAKSLRVVFLFLLLPSKLFALDAWPASSGTVIAHFSDASGIVWHEERKSLFVVQNTGRLNELDENGNLLNSWNIGGDLEGITLAENPRFLYLGIENPDSIVEFDLQTQSLSGKVWDLTAWMTGPSNSGLEGLAYRGGYFLAGLQADGNIYVFQINLNLSQALSLSEIITPYPGYVDTAAIEYNPETAITYVVYDSANALIELDGSNQIVKQYALPGTAQEGIAIRTNCAAETADLFITHDDNGEIVKYTNYPVSCRDSDADGVDASLDCNDHDPSVSGISTYFRDADGDGMGDAFTSEEICAATAPQGYAANALDSLDLASNGRMMYINGTNYTFFENTPNVATYTSVNFYNDAYEEVIAVGLLRSKVQVVVARVSGNSVKIFRKSLSRRYQSARIVLQPSKKKFHTVFNGRRRFTWKVKHSGAFSRN